LTSPSTFPPSSGSGSLSPGPRARQEAPAILVTGICGRLGRTLCRQLHREGRVIGIDRRAFPDKPKDVEHHAFDLRRKKTRDILRSGNVEAIVHLGVLHDPRASATVHHEWNVAGFQKLLEAAAHYGVKKLVVLSSANAYGPRPDNAQFLTEDSPLLGGAAFSEIRDLIEVDMLAQSFFWKHPQTETVVLRPAHILGSVRNAASNYLRLPVVPTLLGFDPMVQVIHEADVVSAIRKALLPGVRGVFNLAGPTPVPLSKIIKMLGKNSLPIPYALARASIAQMFKMHMTSFPAPELDHIRYVCMVDDKRAREQLGYRPERGLDQTVAAITAGAW
jgi:UDP-glucose 4-epimerase